MFSAITLFLPISLCLAAPAVTEDQLRSLIQPLMDANQSPKVTADSPSLFASLAAVSPLDTLLVMDKPLASDTNTNTQISPANAQQLAQLNLAGGITNLVKSALGSLRPSTESAPPVVDPIFGNTGGMYPGFPNSQPLPSGMFPGFPNSQPLPGGMFPGIPNGQPFPAPMTPQNNNRNNNNNMFNPFSFLFSGRNPFGMMMPSLMMRMMEGLMELF